MQEKDNNSYQHLRVFTDGGARGNPGPAGIGVAFYDDAGELIEEHGEYLGEKTNNQAEYQAILYAVKRARELRVAHLDCFLDSELIVKQIAGEYRVKNKALRVLFDEVKKYACKFEKITFQHVPRDENKEADRLVNEAIDSGAGVV